MDERLKKIKSFFTSEVYFVTKFRIVKDGIATIIFGFIFSVVLNILKYYSASHDFADSISKVDFKISFWWYLLSFFLGFIFKTVIYNNIATTRKIASAEYGIGNDFFTLLKHLLQDLGSVKERSRELKLKETSYFLKINNARTGHMLQFSPDNDSINMLHQVEGMISITQADPSEWLNPTYNFFLVNNYLASIIQSVKRNLPVGAISFSASREDASFIAFETEKKDILLKLSKLDVSTNIISFLKEKNIFIRFYILKEEDIENNRSIIETLIAGHDLFGCYLYFINSKVIDEFLKADIDKERLMNFIKSVNYELKENSNKIDLAVALVESSLKVIYRKQDELISKKLDIMNSAEFQSFIVKICGLLHSNYDQQTHLLNSSFINKGFTLNNQFCHITIDKTNNETKA